MSLSKVDLELLEVDGIIERVDVPGRELTVRVGHASRQFALAPGCPLVLHGERVKLRMLQALDRARLDYAREGENLIAYRVRVR
jgi:hypothetical protein